MRRRLHVVDVEDADVARVGDVEALALSCREADRVYSNRIRSVSARRVGCSHLPRSDQTGSVTCNDASSKGYGW
jgi:hypothetical protein